jgi:DnaA family protein
MVSQVPLPLSAPTHASFENFFPGEGAEPIITQLQSLQGEHAPRLLYLWGGEGGGKSHLLNAACARLEQQGVQPLYLPLKLLLQYPPERAQELLAGCPDGGVVVADDLHLVVGERHWEEALFHHLNEAKDRQQRLLLSGRQPLAELLIRLPDLRSRLAEAVTWQLQPLTDQQKWRVLQQRAEARGMVIRDELVAFLINRIPRDFHTLSALLERLDRETLAAQRKLTIPFVKQLLGL